MRIFLILNVIDWIAGTYKARKNNEESSAAGLKGICKKIGYWALLLVAFLTGQNLIAIGQKIGITLIAAEYIGWLTLAMLVVNEARSIIENLTELGVAVPDVMIKGLSVTKEQFESKSKEKDE